MSKGIWIAVSGEIGAGKTTVSEWFRRDGYSYVRYSHQIASMLTDAGMPISRENLQDYGQRIYETIGGEGLTRLVVEPVRNHPYVVVDGVRHRSDLNGIRAAAEGRLVHLHIEACYAIRSARYALAHGVDPSEYCVAGAHAVESEIAEIATDADFTVLNEGSVMDLHDRLRHICERIQEGS